jgi:hypothetical protein
MHKAFHEMRTTVFFPSASEFTAAIQDTSWLPARLTFANGRNHYVNLKRSRSNWEKLDDGLLIHDYA